MTKQDGNFFFEELQRQAFGSPGGKSRIVSKLTAFIPSHKVYVEAFAGGAALFWNKDPSEKEILNDLDPEIYHAYLYIKNITEEKIKKLQNDYDWNDSKKQFFYLRDDFEPKSDADKFYKFIYTIKTSYGLARKTYGYKRVSKQQFFGYLENLPKLKERLQNVEIFNKDYKEIIEKYDSENTFFYLDPPYPEKWGFITEAFKEEDYEKMHEVLSKVKGKFLLSTNILPWIHKLFSDFNVIKVLVPRTFHKKDQAVYEYLISNFDKELAETGAPDVAGSPFTIGGLQPVWIWKPRKKKKEKKIDLASLPIYHGDISKRGPKIYLKDFLEKWASFKLFEDGIMLVGSLANWGETTGDIDIIVKADEKSELFELLSWRIYRAYPEYARRIHIIPYGVWKGPFTNHIPLGDISVIRPEKLETHEMSKVEGFDEMREKSRKEDKLELFRAFYQAKPTHGRKVGQIYSYENLIPVINQLWPEWKRIGISVGKKWDGTTCQVHKKGKEVKIWAEDGKDITKNVPSIVKQISEKPGDWIVLGEVEYWKDGKHMPRAMTAGIINAKEVRPEEKDIRITLYEKLYFEKDTHEIPYSERQKHLHQINETENVKVSKEILVKDEKSLLSAMKHFEEMEGSEGVMFKLNNASYNLDPSTKSMIKFKTERFLIAEVIRKYKVKGAEAWYYDCALEDAPYAGRTYNTSINAKIGDHVKIIFVDISEYKDPKTEKIWFNWWAPRVVEISKEPLSDSKLAHKYVIETTGRFADKSVPKLGLPAEEEMDLAEQNYKLTFLGTLGEDIKPKEGHKKESSLLLEWKDKSLMIDVGESQTENLREIKPNYILLTHAHPDHVKGLTEGTDAKVFASKFTLREIRDFPLENVEILRQKFKLNNIEIETIPILHSIKAPAVAFKIKIGNKIILYAPDLFWIKQEKLTHVNIFIADGSSPTILIRRKGEKVYGHNSMLNQLKWAIQAGIKKIIFTHFGEKTLSKEDESLKTLKEIGKKAGIEVSFAKDETVLETKELAEKRNEFVIQVHFRGASAHFDMRLGKDDTLEGFTMATAFADKIKEPVLSVEEGKQRLKDPSIWKLDVETGKEKERETVVKKIGEKIWCDFKAEQPIGWLKVEGKTPTREEKPVPGGTRKFPGIFVIVDKGIYSRGADKPYFKEYFLYGNKWKGRFIFRQVGQMIKTRMPLTWLYWKAKEIEPYVLSRRAINEKWLPENYSALPFEFEKKVPSHLNYWKGGLRTEERLERREAVRNLFLKEKILSSSKFTLTRRWWKGQEVVRKLPFEDWHIKLDFIRFHLDKNPVYSERTSALKFEGQNEFFEPKEYEPLSPEYINPNKEISSFVEVVDSGDYEIERKTENLIQVKFKGKELSGMFIFKKISGEDIWSLFQQEAPKTE